MLVVGEKRCVRALLLLLQTELLPQSLPDSDWLPSLWGWLFWRSRGPVLLPRELERRRGRSNRLHSASSTTLSLNSRTPTM
mmetsp:Transcript_88514/g.255340  ORF Transcript_88514/g.255340 Transcript_88514/m.255340 type:complete len:81 (+) Transcript_88514:72-314(+)